MLKAGRSALGDYAHMPKQVKSKQTKKNHKHGGV